MNYKTIDELNNFDFSESVISEVETMNGTFHLWLDNVTILPECSCNRDIRVMRANGFLLSVSNPDSATASAIARELAMASGWGAVTW